MNNLTQKVYDWYILGPKNFYRRYMGTGKQKNVGNSDFYRDIDKEELQASIRRMRRRFKGLMRKIQT